MVLLCVSYQPVAGDLYVTTRPTHKRQTNKSPVGFEPVIPASELPQTHGLDRAATGIGRDCLIRWK